MTRNRMVAPILLGSCLLSTPIVPLAMAQDRPMVTSPAATDTAPVRRDDHRDFGWIGLLGLIGLAGLVRGRRGEHYAGRAATATR